MNRLPLPADQVNLSNMAKAHIRGLRAATGASFNAVMRAAEVPPKRITYSLKSGAHIKPGDARVILHVTPHDVEAQNLHHGTEIAEDYQDLREHVGLTHDDAVARLSESYGKTEYAIEKTIQRHQEAAA